MMDMPVYSCWIDCISKGVNGWLFASCASWEKKGDDLSSIIYVETYYRNGTPLIKRMMNRKKNITQWM